MTTSLHTIGHSSRSSGELVSLLRAAGVLILVDVRQQPESARHPQFGQENLRTAVDSVDIEYHWAGRQLGGHRPARAESPHLALTNDGLRGFADYMDGEAFKKGVLLLLGLANRATTAILCAEREPLHCHRSLIADYLTLQGIEVMHLLGPGEQHPHPLRPEVRRESQRLVYDRFATGELALNCGERLCNR